MSSEDNGEERCDSCGGSGVWYFDHNEHHCETCKGTGWVKRKEYNKEAAEREERNYSIFVFIIFGGMAAFVGWVIYQFIEWLGSGPPL